MTIAQTAENVRIYPAKGRIGLQAAAFLIGGILFLLMLVALFLLKLALPERAHSGTDMMPGMIGGMSVIGIGLIGRGIFLLKSLQRVIVDGDGVHLQGFISRSTVRWPDIEWLAREKQNLLFGAQTIDVLKILGDRGRLLAKIPDTLMDFPGLVREIEARSTSARGASTYDAAADEKRRTAKESKNLKWASFALALFALLMGTMFCVGINEELHLRRYGTEGVRTNASILRRWMVRVTPRIAYRFRDQSGQEHTREAMMDQAAWDALNGELAVRVEYLRSDPQWNRLASGEDAGASFAGGFLALTGAGFLGFGGLFLFAALGFDLKIDDGIMKLVRRGRVLKEFGPRSTKPPPLWPGMQMPPPPPVQAPPLAPTMAMVNPPSKPRGLITLGILCIAFGMIGAALALLRALIMSKAAIQLPDGREVATAGEWWLRWWNVADGILAVMLIVAGIQLLGLMRSGRTLGIFIAALQILSSIGAIIVLVVTMAQMPEQTGPHSMTVVAEQIAAIVGQLIGMGFPIVLLVILSKKKTAQALMQG